jgi:hypothetical protein
VQTRYVAVCDKLGRPLKTYPIAIACSNDATQDSDFAREALERAKLDRLVPEDELSSLTVRVPEKMKLWR